jgi:transcriptional regulator with XRE-family HTH domain
MDAIPGRIANIALMGDLLPMGLDFARTEPLWRDLTGEVLRECRHARGEKLRETAERAGVSPQYLSEIERGRKDPSSELLSAVTGALDLTLLDLTIGVARRLHVLGHADTPIRQDVGPLRPLALAA